MLTARRFAAQLYHGSRRFLLNSRTFYGIRDKNYQYLRNSSEYKNSVVHLNDDLKVVGPDCSFVVNELNVEVDKYFNHLTVRDNVIKLSTQQMKDLLFLMANMQIDVSKYGMILKYLDEKCALSVERWPLDVTFYVLDAWFIIWGPKMFRKHFYSAVTSLWGRRMNKISKKNLILMLYFIGVSKEAPPFLMEMIEDKMEHFALEFSDEEWAVACLGFFKTSKRINSKSILEHCCRAMERLFEKNDRFNAISILKCLRLSKYYDAQVWENLKTYALKTHPDFDFVQCSNFLAAFSTQNMYDKALFCALEDQCIRVLEAEKLTDPLEDEDIKTHLSVRSRVKDIARVMWALTSMGHDIKTETLKFIKEFIKFRLSLGEFDNAQCHFLVDYTQSLALAGHYPHDVFASVLNHDFLKSINNLNKAKPKYQLYFVQRSIQIEEPEFEMNLKNLFNPIPKNLEKEIADRGFKTLINILEKNGISKFKPCYLMPHIMISGILLGVNPKVPVEKAEDSLDMYRKYLENGILSRQVEDMFRNYQKFFCLEILDPSVCVNGGTEPHGLMRTKLRQLSKLKFEVVTFLPNEINEKQGNGKIGHILEFFK